MDATLLSRAARTFGNVEVLTIDVNREKDHPAMRFLPSKDLKPPVALLVGLDGRSLAIPFAEPAEGGDASPFSLRWDPTASPVRSEIVKNAVESHCVAVFVPGKDAAANRAALDIVNAAIERTASLMPMMIRPRGTAPHLVTIPREKIRDERVLLWSLGIDPGRVDEPHVAALYGRCRRIGPLLAGDRIQEKVLLNIFMLVGEDCECELDRRLLMGLMIPHEWRDESTSRVQEMLGFNPENPVVRMEVSQIMSSGPGSATVRTDLSSYFDEAAPFGYSEQVITFERSETQTPSEPQVPVDPVPDTPEEPPPGSLPDEPAGDEEEEPSPYRKVPFAIATLVVVVAAGLVVIVARARQRVI